MLNIWYMFIPFLGAIFGILHFFYIKRGRATEEFDHPLAFMKNFRLSDVGPLLRAIVVGPLVAIAIFAPFRAIFVGFLWTVGLTKAWIEEFPLEEPAFNAFFGLCGTILGITVGSYHLGPRASA